ncbi:hypothetical protein B0H10DRAFT_1950156 [Mycena sp. CBHHK59/15]|nr:hypothetical protein B0H10DRAFT_1950156 [Mycena sp. CBHHK59/15]
MGRRNCNGLTYNELGNRTESVLVDMVRSMEQRHCAGLTPESGGLYRGRGTGPVGWSTSNLRILAPSPYMELKTFVSMAFSAERHEKNGEKISEYIGRKFRTIVEWSGKLNQGKVDII